MAERPEPTVQRELQRLASTGSATAPDVMWTTATRNAAASISRRRRRARVTVASLGAVLAIVAVGVGLSLRPTGTTTATDSTASSGLAATAPAPLATDQLVATLDDPTQGSDLLARISASATPNAPGAIAMIAPATTPASTVQQPSVSHSRTKIAYVGGTVASPTGVQGPHHIFVMDAQGTNVRAVTSGSVQDTMPAWSTDDTKIAFIRDQHVFVVNADGTGVTSLAPNVGIVHSFTWAPDGSHLVMATGVGISNLQLVPLDGSAPTSLTTPGVEEAYPSYSPDGANLAFTRGNGLVVRNVATGQERAVTTCVYAVTTCVEDLTPSWSPDGRSLAFARNMPSDTGIGSRFVVYSVGADGSGLTQLTPDTQSYTFPSWSA